ncbi:MAG: redoxin domain-containing protein [Ruminococcaceae bacterium]|nr:redoxin domain-containing protein [Oscillospiraceae bacterium]
MKKNIILLVGILLFVLLLVGASVLYQKFSEDYAGDGLAELPGTAETTAAPETTGEETAPPETTSDTAAANTEETAEPERSISAPDFTVIDGEGNEVRLHDRIGRPIVLNFWATWCPYCIKEMPTFETVYKDYLGEVEFMMIDATDGKRETVEGAKAFIESQGYTFPVYYDTASSAAVAYGAYALPMTFFISADGNSILYASGQINEETLRRGIEMINEK